MLLAFVDGSLDKEVTVKYGNIILSLNQIIVLENVEEKLSNI